MIFSFLRLKKNLYNLSLFRTLYVISLIFEIVCFCELISAWINGVFMFWGFLISMHIIFNEPYKLNIRHKKYAIMFVLLNIFTSLFNFSSSILMNIITSFHNFMCMFLFLGMRNNTSRKSIEKEMIFIMNFFVYFSIVFSLCGFYAIFLPKTNFHIGIYSQRFYGISTNPNLAGFISVISIFCCDILRSLKDKCKVEKLSIILCFIVNIITLFLTDSNASFVFIVSYLGIKIIYSTFSKYENLKDIKFIRESFFIIVCLLLIISSSFLLRAACQQCVSRFLSKTESSSFTKMISSEDINYTKIEPIDEIEIGRGNHEISSGRIQLFKQGVKLSKIHPLIGLGRENLPYYGKMYLSGGLAFPSKHQDLHNIYISLIVSYGILGFLLFFVFVIKNLKEIIQKIFKEIHTQNSKLLSKFLAIIIAYFAYGTFEIGIMSGMFLSDILIWLVFGYALSIDNDNTR